MSVRRETNVRLPECALMALGQIAARRRVSRDEVVRQVLEEHVAEQEAREADDRLTHISTVLRYPAPPLRGRSHERLDRPLRLRLGEGAAERACAVSLRLPGQSPRAHRDYQARLLTDAVMTAIAVREPFVDEFLDGLLPLVRHRAALGLWQLAVAVTCTEAERAVLDAAEDVRSSFPLGQALDLKPAERRLLLVAEAIEGDVSWHSSARFTVAANLAREFLTGERAMEYERMFYVQDTDWNELRLDLSHPRGWSVYLHGVPDWHDWSGRGAATVWRAWRKVAVEDLEDWLVSSAQDEGASYHGVAPPGWQLRMPDGWETFVIPHGRGMPTRFAQWIESGRLVVFPLRGRQAVWPLRPGHATPVPGAEPLVAVARSLRPQDVVEYIESILVMWGAPEYGDEDPDDEWRAPNLLLPVDKAFEFGYVTADERRLAMAYARAHTVTLSSSLDEWEPAVQSPVPMPDVRFRMVATRRRTRRTVKPMWLWPGRSVAEEVEKGTSAAVLRWLAERAFWMARREQHGAMEQAWHDGFDHHPRHFWREGP